MFKKKTPICWPQIAINRLKIVFKTLTLIVDDSTIELSPFYTQTRAGVNATYIYVITIFYNFWFEKLNFSSRP
jgi:hypothetical protein